MIKKILKTAGVVLISLVSCLLPLVSAYAQSTAGTSLTITPPFFELNVTQGDSWSSSIRVVNTNASMLSVHTIVMGFGAGDDQGHGSFAPLSSLVGDEDALANWITISSSSINIPPNNAVDVPFSLSVPQNAGPGGHYAAILIGTGAPASQPGVSQVGVSSYISALIFVRVAGDIKESAQIQEFSTDKSSYETPDVHFKINVQNDGNVHVRPVGTIQIYNAFGKERGELSMNGTGNLGYVLPSSSREFDVEWQGQPSLLDIGPYTAVLSLSYGENGAKSVSQTIGFWVLPINQIVEVLLGVIAAASILVFILKRIVRKMLAGEMSKYGGVPARPTSPHAAPKVKVSSSPKEAEILDLRNKKEK